MPAILTAVVLKVGGARALKRELRSGVGCVSCEMGLRKYLAAFDGKRKDFSDVEHLFDALFHEDFTLVTADDGNILTRDMAKEMDSECLSNAVMMSLVYYRTIGMDCVEVKLRVESENESEDVRMVCSIEDDKFAKMTVVDFIAGLMKARGLRPKIVRPKRAKKKATAAIEKCKATLSTEPKDDDIAQSNSSQSLIQSSGQCSDGGAIEKHPAPQ